MESHRGADSRTIQALHDYLVRMEAQFVTVRDTGTAAVRTLHDELLMVRQTPPMEVHGPTVPHLREDLITPRTQVDKHAATIHSTRTTLTSELDGKLRGARMAIIH
eukprot:2680756-Pyramimonas_sp.AAC.1